jgi:hypothetical protein
MYCTLSRMAQNNAWFLDNWDLYRSQRMLPHIFFNNFELILFKLIINRQIRSRIHKPCFHLTHFQS